jgi:hypothetical protein
MERERDHMPGCPTFGSPSHWWVWGILITMYVSVKAEMAITGTIDMITGKKSS